ncbi:MAG TPA: NADPH-dependent F420 reductase [Acidimicrobiales bacterium]|nr:NADPH-dependent F420 reductase [Acidimicrobiales bacterium]
MHVGILGGTGPAGRGLAVRLAAAGAAVTIGSREAARGESIAAELADAWPERPLALRGTDNEGAAAAELVVVGTPWDGAVATARALRGPLEGKVVVSMAVALLKEGREMVALAHARGSMAGALQAALPGSLVAGAFHHLPASTMEALDTPLAAHVLVCSDHKEATAATLALVESIDGLVAVDAGSLAQAGAVEAFTAVLINVNILHKVHSTLVLGGLDR